MFLLKNIWLILFIVWGLPLTFYRSKFRKIVYQTDKLDNKHQTLFYERTESPFWKYVS